MKYNFLLALWVLTLPLFAQRNEKYDAYIKRYSDIAISEMQRAKIPASITMAQALLESGAGSSALATKANNHFGIKCGGAWQGGTMYVQDDEKDEAGNTMPSCFRKYGNADESFVDHSEFLADPRKTTRYGALFDLPITDYEGWARGLQSAGYATNPKYSALLISLVEKYNLADLDKDSGPIASAPMRPIPGRKKTTPGVSRINDCRVVIAQTGNSMVDIAKRHDISIEKMRKYNERLNAPSDAPLPEKTKVFLQRKRGAFRGKEKYHYVKQGETMYSIAQQYGMRLPKIYKRNRLEEGTQPQIGARLKLRGRVPKDEVPPSRKGTGKEDSYQVGSTAAGTKPNPSTGSSAPQPKPKPTTTTPAKTGTDGTLDFEISPGSVTQTGETPAKPTPPSQVERPTTSLPQTPPAPTNSGVFHVVQPGETLYRVSKIYGISVEKLQQLNNLGTSTSLSVGQKLLVK